MKWKTISTRWSDWTNTSVLDKWLARITLVMLASSLLGLWTHLWVLMGVWRTVGLITMIVMVVLAEGIMIWRATKIQTVWWWVAFWGWIILSVILFELASVICSSIWGF
jgi:hypothetical protein